MRATLITSPYLNRREYACTPLGVASLASSLDKEGIDVNIIDATALSFSIEQIVKELRRNNTDVVGISAMSSDIRTAVFLAREIKKEFPDLPIILGGHHATYDYGNIGKYDCFDHIFVGEGEISFPQMLQSIEKGEQVSKVVFGKSAENLDELPLPMHNLLPIQNYFLPYTREIPSYVGNTRGCIFKCRFCSINKHIRWRSVDKVVEEITILKDKYNVGWIEFSDALFAIDRRHAAKLCDAMIENKIDIEWGCQTRVGFVDRTLGQKMFKAGCRMVSLGIESGSYRIRQIIGKPFTDIQVKEAVDAISWAGIEISGLFILGFPDETFDEMMQTVKMGMKLKLDYAQFVPLHLYPGTFFFEDLVNKGELKRDAWNDFIDGERTPIYIPKHFSEPEYFNFLDSVNKNFYFRASVILSKMRKIKNMQDIKRYIYYSKFLTNYIKSKMWKMKSA